MAKNQQSKTTAKPVNIVPENQMIPIHGAKLAEALGISDRQIQDNRRAGKLKGYKVGRTYFYFWPDVAEWIKSKGGAENDK